MKRLLLVWAICCVNAGIASATLDSGKIDQITGLKGMHIEGEGSVEQLASAVKKMYDSVKAIRGPNTKPAESFADAAAGQPKLPEKNSIDPAPLNKIFGAQGEAKDGMVKFTFGRPATMHGTNIAKEMGVNTWAAFAGTDDNAVVDGDFAVAED